MCPAYFHPVRAPLETRVPRSGTAESPDDGYGLASLAAVAELSWIKARSDAPLSTAESRHHLVRRRVGGQFASTDRERSHEREVDPELGYRLACHQLTKGRNDCHR